jgi:hypothetical protein
MLGKGDCNHKVLQLAIPQLFPRNKIISTTVLFITLFVSEIMAQNATCQPGYDWADNEAGVSPCGLAAMTTVCGTDAYTLPPLQPGNSYDPPNLTSDTVNVCRCSWAVYNLISMCTLCQGQTPSLSPWASYSVQCTGFTESNSYFPSNVALPSNASIPLYAQANPNQWTDGVFNDVQAKELANGTITALPSSSATALPTGTLSSPQPPKDTAAIIGASVGGATLLLSVIGAALWFWRSRTRDDASAAGSFHRLSASPPNSRHSTVSEVPHSILGHNRSIRHSQYTVQFLGNDYSLVPSTEGRPVSARTVSALIQPQNPLIPIPFTSPQSDARQAQRKSSPSAIVTTEPSSMPPGAFALVHRDQAIASREEDPSRMPRRSSSGPPPYELEVRLGP